MARIRVWSRALNPYWRRRFHSFGRNSALYRPVWIAGGHQISIGDRCLIMSSWLSVEESAWGGSDPKLVIGDRVAIRPLCTISAAESVVIEDDVAISAFSSVSDSRVELQGPPDRIVQPLVTAPVHIGRGAGIGERVAVLPGSTIGEHAVIGTNSVVDGDIPAYAFAVGAPARVVGRTRDRDARR